MRKPLVMPKPGSEDAEEERHAPTLTFAGMTCESGSYSAKHVPLIHGALTRAIADVERGVSPGLVPSPPPSPTPVWADEAGRHYVARHTEQGITLKRYHVGKPTKDGAEAIPRGFVPAHRGSSGGRASSTPPARRSNAESPDVASTPAGQQGAATPQPHGDDKPLPQQLEYKLGMAAAQLALQQFAAEQTGEFGMGSITGMLKGGARALLGGLMGAAFDRLLGGLFTADDSSSLAQQLAARFAVPAAVGLPHLLNQLTDADVGPGIPICRGDPGDAWNIIVEGHVIGSEVAQVVDGVLSLYDVKGDQNVFANGRRLAVSTDSVQPYAGAPHVATPAIHAASVFWSKPPVPVGADGQPLKDGDLDTDHSLGGQECRVLEEEERKQVLGIPIEKFEAAIFALGLPRFVGDLSNADERLAYWARYSNSHVWNSRDGFSASLTDYFPTSSGGLGGLLNSIFEGLDYVGDMTGLFALGSREWPGAGTGSIWWAPDQILTYDIRQLYVGHDAVFGVDLSLRTEGNALYDALAQNPSITGLVYGAVAVSATTTTGVISGYYDAGNLIPFFLE